MSSMAPEMATSTGISFTSSIVASSSVPTGMSCMATTTSMVVAEMGVSPAESSWLAR